MKILLRFEVEDSRLAQWRARFPQAEFVPCEGEGIPAEHCDAVALMGGWRLDRAMADMLPGLRWVQATFTGVESFLDAGLAERGIALTNFKGVAAPNIAEHVMGMMLAFARGLPELLRRQQRHDWRPYGEEPPTFELSGQRLGLIGMGEISQQIAIRAKRGFGMAVWGLRRNTGRPLPPCVDAMFSAEQLTDLLEACDHVVLATALTEETRGMINAATLGRMKPSALIYNVGRGELIRQDALVTALQEGRIAGAGLDVTHPEPLPANSLLWDMPNVIITAHTAGPTRHYWDRGYALFASNIERFVSGQPLLNLVNQSLGY